MAAQAAFSLFSWKKLYISIHVKNLCMVFYSMWPWEARFVDKLCAQIKNIEIIICDDSEAGIILRDAANRILKAEAWWNMDKNQTRRREYRFKIQRPSRAETWKSEFSPACPALYSLRSVKRLEIYEGFRIFKLQFSRIFQATNVVCLLCLRNILNFSCLCRSAMKTWICFLSTLIVFRKVNNLQIFELEKEIAGFRSWKPRLFLRVCSMQIRLFSLVI